MLRTALAVIAGILTWFIGVMIGTIGATALFVTGEIATAGAGAVVQLPFTFLAANMVVSMVAAAGAGWISARMDDPGRWRAVIGLAVLVILVSVTNVRAPHSPIGTLTWYPWLLMIVSVAGVALGGWARRSAVDFPATAARTV